MVIALAALAMIALWVVSGLDRADVDPSRFFDRAQIDRANDYRVPLYGVYLARLAVDLTLLSLLAFTAAGGWLTWFRDRHWAVGAVGAVVALLLLRVLVRLPFSFWSGYLHEKEWGFSTQSVGGWFGDLGRSLGIAVVVGGVVYLGFVAMVRWVPRWWPAVLAVAAAGFVALASFVWPVLVEPIFNRFEPLEGPRAAELRSLADRAGVPVREVLISDASRRTTKENAYVSGLGGTRRLVVYDTLLERASFEEVKLVVAHELGHRKENHVLWGTVLAALAAAGGVLVVWGMGRWLGLVGEGRDAADPRLLPLLLLAVALLTLAAAPPSNWFSRRLEERADRFALALTEDRNTYVEAERNLALRNLSDLDPGPLVYRWFYTHPPAAERISYAFEGRPQAAP